MRRHRMPRSNRLTVVLLAGALLAAGCGAPAPRPSDAAAAFQDPPMDAPLWQEEGLAAQRRLAWLRERIPPELGYQPGTTPWRPANLELPSELTSPAAANAAAPGILLGRLIAAIGWDTTLGTDAWEQTTRILQDDDETALGAVLRWGLRDDAIAGHDLRVQMRKAMNGWYVERVQERFHCSRGVSEEGLCL